MVISPARRQTITASRRSIADQRRAHTIATNPVYGDHDHARDDHKRKAGTSLAEHTDHAPAAGRTSATDEILAMIATEEPHGATPDQVARALGLTLDGEALQSQLEEMVA